MQKLLGTPAHTVLVVVMHISVYSEQTMFFSVFRPLSSPGDLWELVSDCHQWEVDERPSFTEIIAMELFNVVNKRPPLSSASLTAIPESGQPLVLTNSGQL